MKHAIVRSLCVALGALAVMAPFAVSPADKSKTAQQNQTYQESEVLKEAEAFFGKGAKGLGDIIAKAFKDQGEPNGFIKGEEAGGAIGIGLRYGHGTLQMRSGTTKQVYWQGPSIGFDVGGNAAKTFVLVYKLNDTEKLFQRFPGVEGSLYFVGGVGLRYLHADGITLAPVQLGVGWRQGANVGYMNFSKKKRLNPF